MPMSVQVIEKNGKPEWAVLPYDEYERLVEEAEMLQDVRAYTLTPPTREKCLRSKAKIHSGLTMSDLSRTISDDLLADGSEILRLLHRDAASQVERCRTTSSPRCIKAIRSPSRRFSERRISRGTVIWPLRPTLTTIIRHTSI
jgi:PHD/YefM family antitoxin component YafN of YafNO toxin-antitoxin module